MSAEDSFVMTREWARRVANAPDLAALAAVTRDFLATISPHDVQALPPDCRPPRIVDSDDVVGYAFSLKRKACVSVEPQSALLSRLAAVMVEAAQRASTLKDRTGREGHGRLLWADVAARRRV